MQNSELKWSHGNEYHVWYVSAAFLLFVVCLSLPVVSVSCFLLLSLSSWVLWVCSCLPPASCSAVICSTCDLVCVFCLCQIIGCFHPSVLSLASPERWHLLLYLFFLLFPALRPAMFCLSVSAVWFQFGSLCASEWPSFLWITTNCIYGDRLKPNCKEFYS